MWIEVFKAGVQTDSAGNTRDWTQEDLDAIVEKYNEQPEGEEHRAPVVIGHPTDISPAYAWVSALKRDGDSLYAEIVDVQPEFAEWVNKGLYRERSIALDSNGLFVHLGFLGGVPPAVKGLEPVRFNEGKPLQTFSISGAVTPQADPSAAPVASPVGLQQTVEQVLAAQQERAKAYGIRVQENGNTIKPTAFADLTDDQFGDPVNYRWPIGTEAQILATRQNLHWYQYSYNETEQIVILARIIDAAKGFGLDVKTMYFNAGTTPKMWALGRDNQSTTFQANTSMDNVLNGLVEWLRTTYNEETAQQTQAQIDALKESMTQSLTEWLTSTFGEEVGTAAATKIAELSSQATEPSATPADPAAADTAASAPPAAGASTHAASTDVKTLMQRVAELEKDKRATAFAAFADQMITEGRLTPANREQLIDQLENAHQSDTNGATKDSVKTTMEFMRSMPKVVSTTTFATADRASGSTFKKGTLNVGPGATVDPESVKRREKVEAYAAKHNVTYTQAFNALKAQGEL